MRTRRIHRFQVGIATLVVSLAPVVARAQQTEVTTCGQIVSGSAYLSADLDCSASSDVAVTLNGGTLDLRGFTITGPAALFTGNLSVTCTAGCTITSYPPGGTLKGGVNSDRANIATTDILLDGSTIPSGLVTNTGRVLARRTSFVEAGVRGWIIKMYECTVTGSNAFSWKKTLIRNSQFTNCPDAIASQERVVVIDSTIMGGVGDGIDAGVSVRVVGSTVSGFEDDGIEDFGGNAKVQNSEISNNGNRGIFSPFLYASVRVQNSIIAGNGAEGIYAPTYRGRVTVTSGSQITGNGLDGISSGPCITGDCPKFVLKDSTATGNGTDSDCGVTLACADLSAGRVPTVSNSTCDHTYDTNSGFPGTNWNVCTLD